MFLKAFKAFSHFKNEASCRDLKGIFFVLFLFWGFLAAALALKLILTPFSLLVGLFLVSLTLCSLTCSI